MSELNAIPAPEVRRRSDPSIAGPPARTFIGWDHRIRPARPGSLSAPTRGLTRKTFRVPVNTQAGPEWSDKELARSSD